MRIGYIYDLKAFPPKGGNHRHAYELTKGFIKFGHEVSVVDDPTMPSTTNYTSELSDLKSFIESIDILYVRIDARLTRKWTVLNKLMVLLDNRPVVWEINSPASENLAYSWLGGKAAFNNTQPESSLKKLKRWFHAVRKMPGIFVEEQHRKKLARFVNHAICVSGAVGKYAAHDLGIRNISIMPNGGPLITNDEIVERDKRRNDNDFTVVYTGSAIYPWQGLNILIEAINISASQSLGLKFVIATNQKTDMLPVTSNCLVLVGLTQDEVRDVICSADVCVAMIPEWPWAKYGFHGSPTKLFEYMALRRTVVTSNHGQMSEILNDGIDAILCSYDTNELLSKLLELKSNREKTRMIGKNAWQRVHEEFNWGCITEKTLLIFESIVNRNSKTY